MEDRLLMIEGHLPNPRSSILDLPSSIFHPPQFPSL
jgi:hypothetical protein